MKPFKFGDLKPTLVERACNGQKRLSLDVNTPCGETMYHLRWDCGDTNYQLDYDIMPLLFMGDRTNQNFQRRERQHEIIKDVMVKVVNVLNADNVDANKHLQELYVTLSAHILPMFKEQT